MNFNINPIEENSNKLIDLKKAQQKIKEMEECLKTMNIENDSLKGKLGNVISNLNTPQENNLDNDEEENNFIHGREYSHENENDRKIKKNKKNKRSNNFSTVNNDTLEDLRARFKNSKNTLNNNSEYLVSHFRGHSAIPYQNDQNDIDSEAELISQNENEENFENEEISSPENRGNNNINNNYYSTGNQKHQAIRKHQRQESTGKNFKYNRHLTLGKSGQQHIFGSIEENNNNEEKDRGMQYNFNSNIENFKVNPFVDNTSTFINNDYENMNEKISNLENIEDDNENSINDNEERDNYENYYEFNNNKKSEFPLQLKLKGMKKKNLN